MMSIDEQRFFEYGSVSVLYADRDSRKISLSIKIPCFLLQAVSGALFMNGSIEQVSIMHPIAAWIPRLDKDQLNHDMATEENVTRLNVVMKEESLRSIKLFSQVANHVKNPRDLVCILPLGIYVEFRYNIIVENVIKIISDVDTIRVYGVPAFQSALASALRDALIEFGDTITLLPLNERLIPTKF